MRYVVTETYQGRRYPISGPHITRIRAWWVRVRFDHRAWTLAGYRMTGSTTYKVEKFDPRARLS